MYLAATLLSMVSQTLLLMTNNVPVTPINVFMFFISTVVPPIVYGWERHK